MSAELTAAFERLADELVAEATQIAAAVARAECERTETRLVDYVSEKASAEARKLRAELLRPLGGDDPESLRKSAVDKWMRERAAEGPPRPVSVTDEFFESIVDPAKEVAARIADEQVVANVALPDFLLPDALGKVTRKIGLGVIHCAYTKPSMDVGAAEIRRWHLARGFNDIGYHAVVCRNGEIEAGRNMNTSGAHVRGWNKHSIGVCLVGGRAENADKPERNYTDAQMDSLEQVVRALIDRWLHIDIVGHCDLPNVKKACPVFVVEDWLNSLGIEDHDNFGAAT